MDDSNKTPAEKDNEKAAEVMERAIDKTIAAEKSRRPGTDDAERRVADDLKRAAEEDAKKSD